VKAVYRDAIDSTAEDRAGDSWWAAVADEVTASLTSQAMQRDEFGLRLAGLH